MYFSEQIVFLFIDCFENNKRCKCLLRIIKKEHDKLVQIYKIYRNPIDENY